QNKLFNKSKKIFIISFIISFVIVFFTGCKIEFPEKISSQNEVSDKSSSNYSSQTSENQNMNSSQNVVSKNLSSKQTVNESQSSLQSNSSQLTKPKPSSTNSKKPDVTPATSSVSSTENKSDELTCTLQISCKEILKNMNSLDKRKIKLVPKDGFIYKERTVTFKSGESAFDVLYNETKKNRIHMEFESTPFYKSNYVEGINNLYQFDCGNGSGWMYKVNGSSINYGSSNYKVKKGDKIEWLYTLDLGKDTK
ncbi:MAG: DUF4430 domain-containing protein, partial [Oscillospiraceae bacterium]